MEKTNKILLNNQKGVATEGDYRFRVRADLLHLLLTKNSDPE